MIAGDFYFYYWKIDSLFCLFLETAFLLFALAQCTPLCFAIFFGLANLDTNVEATDTVPDGVVNFKRQFAAVETLVHKPHKNPHGQGNRRLDDRPGPKFVAECRRLVGFDARASALRYHVCSVCDHLHVLPCGVHVAVVAAV